MEKWMVIIICAVLSSLLLVLGGAAYNSKVAQVDIEREKSVQSACMSAIETTDKMQNLVFDTESELLSARRAFWFSYCRSNHYSVRDTGTKNYATSMITKENFFLDVDSAAKFEIPFVFYVDRDGYYIEYTRLVKNGSGTEYQLFMTDKQFFSTNYPEASEKYVVTYRLDERVMVVACNSGISVEGTYKECYEKLKRPTALKFMSTEDSFWREHDLAIVTLLSDKINYYVNTHNNNGNLLERKYCFAMPSDASNVGRLMRTPCVISFSQGNQSKYQNVNSYGFAGASIEKERIYYSYYEKTVEDEMTLFYSDEKAARPTTENAGSMRELAKQGAIPDY